MCSSVSRMPSPDETRLPSKRPLYFFFYTSSSQLIWLGDIILQDRINLDKIPPLILHQDYAVLLIVRVSPTKKTQPPPTIQPAHKEIPKQRFSERLYAFGQPIMSRLYDKDFLDRSLRDYIQIQGKSLKMILFWQVK